MFDIRLAWHSRFDRGRSVDLLPKDSPKVVCLIPLRDRGGQVSYHYRKMGSPVRFFAYYCKTLIIRVTLFSRGNHP